MQVDVIFVTIIIIAVIAKYVYIFIAVIYSESRIVFWRNTNIIACVWITFLILCLLIGFLIGRLGNATTYFQNIFAIMLALYGMPVFLSGIILRFRPLTLGGIYCWLLSITATFIPFDYQMLLLSAAMVVAWLIPGYQLRARQNKV